MAAFVYKFENVKKAKDELKKKVQKDLALVENEIFLCKQDLESSLEELIELRNSLNAKDLKVSEIQFNKGCEKLMEKKIESQKDMLNGLEVKKTKVLDELLQKTKEHKIFNTLEDNLREKFIKEQNRLEMKDLDEIAVQKFVRHES